MLAMAKMYTGYNTNKVNEYEYKALAVPDGERYSEMDGRDMGDLYHLLSVSSISVVHESNQREKLDSEASLFLFDGLSQVQPNDLRRLVPQMLLSHNTRILGGVSFQGDYIRVTKPKESGTVNLPNLAVYSWDNRATSALLVSQRHDREERIRASTTFTFPWNLAWDELVTPALDKASPGAKFSRYYDPVFSWFPFPQRDGFSSSQTYLAASQWIGVHAWGIGMNAWVIFYFHLYVTNGNIKFDVIDLDFHVWPGTGQGQLLDGLKNNKNGIMSAMQILSSAFTALLPTNVTSVYLLPGNQTGPVPSSPEIQRGDTLDDVTLVLEGATTKEPPIVKAVFNPIFVRFPR